jgi:hypothetical protein
MRPLNQQKHIPDRKASAPVPLSTILEKVAAQGSAIETAVELGFECFPVRKFKMPSSEELAARLSLHNPKTGFRVDPASVAECIPGQKPPRLLLRAFALAGGPQNGLLIRFKGRDWRYIANSPLAKDVRYCGALIPSRFVGNDVSRAGVQQEREAHRS